MILDKDTLTVLFFFVDNHYNWNRWSGPIWKISWEYPISETSWKSWMLRVGPTKINVSHISQDSIFAWAFLLNCPSMKLYAIIYLKNGIFCRNFCNKNSHFYLFQFLWTTFIYPLLLYSLHNSVFVRKSQISKSCRYCGYIYSWKFLNRNLMNITFAWHQRLKCFYSLKQISIREVSHIHFFGNFISYLELELKKNWTNVFCQAK